MNTSEKKVMDDYDLITFNHKNAFGAIYTIIVDVAIIITHHWGVTFGPRTFIY